MWPSMGLPKACCHKRVAQDERRTRRKPRTANELVLETNIKCSVGVRGEDLARLANNVLGAAVLVPYGILDL